MNLRQALVARAKTALRYCSDSVESKRMAKRLRRKVVRQLGRALIAEQRDDIDCGQR